MANKPILKENGRKEAYQWHRTGLLKAMRNPKTYMLGNVDKRKELYKWYKQAGGKLSYQQAIKTKGGAK